MGIQRRTITDTSFLVGREQVYTITIASKIALDFTQHVERHIKKTGDARIHSHWVRRF